MVTAYRSSYTVIVKQTDSKNKYGSTIFVDFSIIKFHENSSSDSRTVWSVRTEELNKHSAELRKFIKIRPQSQQIYLYI
jgi:hypothetical protein